VIACRIDTWQLRSTTTMSPGATVACHTILFDVDVPLVTKKQWSALKIRAALRSATPHLRSALGREVRLKFLPELVFEEDATLEKGQRIAELLAELRRLEAAE